MARGYLPSELQSDAYNCPAPAAAVALFEYNVEQAAAADDDGLFSVSVNGSAVTVTGEDLGSMPACRNVTVKSTGTEGNVKAGAITITGTDINDDVITETVTVTADTHIAFTGTKAFKTVTKVEIPAQDGAITVKAGWGDLYGLPFKFSQAPLALGAVNFVNEAVTFTVNGADLAKNTFTFASAPAGEAVQLALFI